MDRDNNSTYFSLKKSKTTTKSQKTCRIMTGVSLVLLFVNIALMSSVVVVYFQLKAFYNKARERQDINQFCVPCENLRNSPKGADKDLELFDRKMTNKIQMCCAHNETQTALLLDMYLERKVKERHAKNDGARSIKYVYIGDKNKTEVINAEKPAALVTIDMNNQESDLTSVDGKFMIINWQHENDDRKLGYVRNGIKYKMGRLVVTHSGFYSIYSQVHFMKKNRPVIGATSLRESRDAQKSPFTVGHYIYRYNVIYPNYGEQLLLQHFQTLCGDSDKPVVEHSSYLGSVVKLNAGDEIFIRVTNISLVHRDPIATYFGLAML